MSEIGNKYLLAGDKFMPEMHLKQPGFTYSACGPLLKTKKELRNLCRQEITDFIYKNDLDKACFQHDMAYGKSKDLARRTQSDRISRDETFREIASNPKYDGYKRGLASMAYKFFDKQSSECGVTTVPNYHLTNELHRQIIRKSKRRKV